LKDNLRLIGVRKDIDRLMRAADVLFFPSRQEGLGMVAVEAQAAGLPVLASTAVPRECVVIPELYTALALDEPIEVWAAALFQIMTKPRPPLELCRRALESSPFSIANSARRLEEIYSSTQQ
jgi:glycosyltransferase involved in cell wall biosynthesis